jgi:hypothetical protein
MALVLYASFIACSVAGLWFRGGAGWSIKPSTAAKIKSFLTIPGIVDVGSVTVLQLQTRRGPLLS